VAVGGDTGFCLRATDGEVYCDGYESMGFCASPVWPPIAGVAGAVYVAVGFGHACALLSDQTVECWGDDTFGQLGHGTSGGTGEPPELVTW
jgi:alpha-tubulin suppressor-like RCC1 family protein